MKISLSAGPPFPLLFPSHPLCSQHIFQPSSKNVSASTWIRVVLLLVVAEVVCAVVEAEVRAQVVVVVVVVVAVAVAVADVGLPVYRRRLQNL